MDQPLGVEAQRPPLLGFYLPAAPGAERKRDAYMDYAKGDLRTNELRVSLFRAGYDDANNSAFVVTIQASRPSSGLWSRRPEDDEEVRPRATQLGPAT
jgi:hypothetical protein